MPAVGKGYVGVTCCNPGETKKPGGDLNPGAVHYSSVLPKKTAAIAKPLGFIRCKKHSPILHFEASNNFFEQEQLEKLHRFPPKRRAEEYLSTATMMLDKTEAVRIRVWIISSEL